MPKKNREGQASVLSLEQWHQVWYELDQPYRLITQVAYYCAERPGAAVQLCWHDVGVTHITFRGVTTKMGKTKQNRITPALRQALHEYIPVRESDFLFPGYGASGHITTRALETHLKRAASLLGHEGVSNHSPRRSRCTHLDEAGWTLAKIAKVSGHKSLKALEDYIDRRQQEADDDLMVMDAV